MARINPFEFMQQVREEAGKIIWPSRKETTISVVMVAIMVTLAAIFFLIVDTAINWGVERVILGI